MGKLVERLERHSSKRGAVRQVIYGSAEALAIAAATLPVWLLERTASDTYPGCCSLLCC